MVLATIAPGEIVPRSRDHIVNDRTGPAIFSASGIELHESDRACVGVWHGLTGRTLTSRRRRRPRAWLFPNAVFSRTTKGEVAMDESTSGDEPTNGIGVRSADRQLSCPRAARVRGDELGLSGGPRETGHEVALKVLTRTLARNSTLLAALHARGPQRRDARASQHRDDLRSRNRSGPSLPGPGICAGRRFSRPHPAPRSPQHGRGGLGREECRRRPEVCRQPRS